MRREDVEFLERTGLLAEVNRRVLHPLGLEVHVEFDAAGVGLERTDDPAGFVLRENDLEANLGRYRRFMREVGFERIVARRAARGFATQTPADVDPRTGDPDWTPAARRLADDARAVVEAARDVLAVLDECTDYEEDLGEHAGDLREALRAYDRKPTVEITRETSGFRAVADGPEVRLEGVGEFEVEAAARPDPREVEAVRRAIETGFDPERAGPVLDPGVVRRAVESLPRSRAFRDLGDDGDPE